MINSHLPLWKQIEIVSHFCLGKKKTPLISENEKIINILSVYKKPQALPSFEKMDPACIILQMSTVSHPFKHVNAPMYFKIGNRVLHIKNISLL